MKLEDNHQQYFCFQLFRQKLSYEPNIRWKLWQPVVNSNIATVDFTVLLLDFSIIDQHICK
jgi:hypothetical protein